MAHFTITKRRTQTAGRPARTRYLLTRHRDTGAPYTLPLSPTALLELATLLVDTIEQDRKCQDLASSTKPSQGATSTASETE